MFNFFRKMSSHLNWNVKGVLMDITGVLYESGQDNAIQGSIEAVERLKKLKMPFRFVTNETQSTRSSLVVKLNSFGFNINEKEIISPGVLVSTWIKQQQLRPYLLVHPNILPEFSDCDQTSPNCVVIGDAAEDFSFKNMNRAFTILIKSENPVLISMGKGRYYKDNNELVMDLGGFTAALEYAVGIEAKIIGKPSCEYYTSALKDMGITADEAVMVGDDIHSDVGGAQKCGLKGILVKTGKYRPCDEHNKETKPDAIVDNLSCFVDILTASSS